MIIVNGIGNITDKSPAHCFTQSFNHLLVSELKKCIGTSQHVAAQPVQEKGVCSESNGTASTAHLLQLAGHTNAYKQSLA